MKKKNSIKITVIVTVIVLALAALVLCQPYLNSTPFAQNAEFAAFLGDAFGKYPRFVNEEDFAKIEAITIDGNETTQVVQVALAGYIEKYEAYVEEYNAAILANLTPPAQPDFSDLVKYYETSNGVDGAIDFSLLKNLTEANVYTGVYSISSNLEEFKNITSLKSLNIAGDAEVEDGAKITDISALGAMTELTTLTLSNNAITDISALSGLTKLEYVDLSGNKIADVSALSDKTAITTLVLSDNAITDISALSGDTALQQIYLDDNEISDFSALSGMQSATVVSISNNKIADIAPLATWKDAPNFTISLSGNEITDVSALSAFAESTGQIAILLTENEGVADWSVLDTLPDNITVLNDENSGLNQPTTDEEVTDDTADEEVTDDDTAGEEEATESQPVVDESAETAETVEDVTEETVVADDTVTDEVADEAEVETAE